MFTFLFTLTHWGQDEIDNIFKCIFFNENILISIKISLPFVPKDRINNIPASVQLMAWRRPGDKSLSELMMLRLQTHICVTRPQWVKPSIFYKLVFPVTSNMCGKRVDFPMERPCGNLVFAWTMTFTVIYICSDAGDNLISPEQKYRFYI